MKIEVGHLHGGRAEIYEHGAGHGTLAPFVARPAGRGHLLPRRPARWSAASVAVGKGRAAPAPSLQRRSSRGRQVRGQRQARGDRRCSAPTAPCARAGRSSFPALHQGQCGDVVIGFKKAMRKMGYIANGGRCFGGKTGRERARLPQGQRHDPQHAGRRRAWSRASSAARAATRSATRTPANTSRRRSPSRSWSSPRATSRSRSTRSPPASPRPRPSPATTPSSARNRATTRTGMYYSFYFTAATRSTATNRSARLPRQPRLRPHLHRRPARDLRTAHSASIFVFWRVTSASSWCERWPISAAAKQTLLAELQRALADPGRSDAGQRGGGAVLRRRAAGADAAGGFRAAGELIAAAAHELGADAVGGPATAAIPPACAAIAVPGGPGSGRLLRPRRAQGARAAALGRGAGRGRALRCLVVEDTVTTGGSTAKAIGRIREEGLEVAGVVAVVDRLAGGAEKIEAAAEAPYRALVTIDEIYPDRPDRG